MIAKITNFLNHSQRQSLQGLCRYSLDVFTAFDEFVEYALSKTQDVSSPWMIPKSCQHDPSIIPLQPKILMLDEPTAGVSPIVMDELFDRIIEVSRTGIPILMVEQNARQALGIADTGYVMVQGRNAYTGSGKELLADPKVRKSFLGG